MNMRHVTALRMIGLALLVSFTHAALAQQPPTPLPPAVQPTYTFPCTQDVQGLNRLCFSGPSGPNNVIVLSMVNLCGSSSSFVLVSGRTQVPVLTLEANEELTAPTPITVPVGGGVLAIQTDPEGCEEDDEGNISCLNVTATILFNQPPVFCRPPQ
jgi:hypothetical protein